MTGFTTLGREALSIMGKLHAMYSPGLFDGSDWSFGGQRKGLLMRCVY